MMMYDEGEDVTEGRTDLGYLCMYKVRVHLHRSVEDSERIP
jgi:hypothetical protein